MAVGFVVAWLIAPACSETPDRPPELGKCEFNDASCPESLSGGGTQGAGDAGASPSSCQVNPRDSLCTQCAATNCCPSVAACSANTDCQNLLNCGHACSGLLDCAGSCQSSSGVTLVESLTTCIEAQCPVCSQIGVGDPCSPFGTPCNPGLECNGLWCTKACVRSTDCAGLGAGGDSTQGLPNACIATAAGEECRPGCTQDSDCGAFPGAFCFATSSSDGIAVRVCVPPPDAGAD